MFVKELFNAIESGDYKRFIYWNYDGTEFIIPSKKHFTLYVLGSFTAQNHFTSFERQLNMYEFKRQSDGRATRKSKIKEPIVFAHPDFRRGQRELITKIKRRPRSATPKDSKVKIKPNSHSSKYLSRYSKRRQLIDCSSVNETKPPIASIPTESTLHDIIGAPMDFLSSHHFNNLAPALTFDSIFDIPDLMPSDIKIEDLSLQTPIDFNNSTPEIPEFTPMNLLLENNLLHETMHFNTNPEIMNFAPPTDMELEAISASNTIDFSSLFNTFTNDLNGIFLDQQLSNHFSLPDSLTQPLRFTNNQ